MFCDGKVLLGTSKSFVYSYQDLQPLGTAATEDCLNALPKDLQKMGAKLQIQHQEWATMQDNDRKTDRQMTRIAYIYPVHVPWSSRLLCKWMLLADHLPVMPNNWLLPSLSSAFLDLLAKIPALKLVLGDRQYNVLASWRISDVGHFPGKVDHLIPAGFQNNMRSIMLKQKEDRQVGHLHLHICAADTWHLCQSGQFSCVQNKPRSSQNKMPIEEN